MRRVLSTLTAVAMFAGVFAAAPANSQEAPPPAPKVPEKAMIEDPVGDANFVNDGTPAGIHPALPRPGSNNVTGQDASGAADLLKVWMSHTRTDVSVHFLTEAPPPLGNAVGYSLFIAPGEGEAGSNTVGCLRFVAIIPGTNPGGGSYQGPPWVKAHDRCNVGGTVFDAQDGEYSIAAEGDNGIVTLTFPRAYSPLFKDGTVLKTSYAQAHSPVIGADGGGFVTPSTDDTVGGLDYTVAPLKKVTPPKKPPVKKPKPKKLTKKACLKLKGKARSKCLKKLKAQNKKPKVKKCAPYKPGEAGAEAPLAVVTNAATEEKPMELTLATDPGLGVGRNPASAGAQVSHVFQNVQVDPTAKRAGLYMRVEFQDYQDYDLYLDRADGSNAATAAGFSDAEQLQDGDTSDGHTEIGAEQVTGIDSADCGGYTADIVGATTQGGDVTVKLWLGPITFVPEAPAP